jgi:tRNA pseudouridine32 synthase/23S rRNA pseudouridine746 synthase
MSHQQERSPSNNVVLTWKVPQAETSSVVRVYLEPASSSHDVVDRPSKDNQVDDSDEAAVLQLERQMRKAAHAKKAGAVVRPEDLVVIYHDEHLVVVNKPPGVMTVPGLNSRSSILDLVYQRFGPPATTTTEGTTDASTAANRMVIHRLDMDTSGLIVFGRTIEATRALHQQFRDREVHKEYECLVVGHMPTALDALLLDLPLQRDHAHPPFRRVSTPASEEAAANVLAALHSRGMRMHWKIKRPQQSQTRVKVIERVIMSHTSLACTRLRLEPITGRTHQLRVHCAALGYPIVGDPTYGLYGEAAPVGGLQTVRTVVKEQEATQEMIWGCPLDLQKEWTDFHPPNEKRMLLHAALLELNHPITGETMKWEAPPDF